jgi:hypothetical protein
VLTILLEMAFFPRFLTFALMREFEIPATTNTNTVDATVRTVSRGEENQSGHTMRAYNRARSRRVQPAECEI